MIRFSKSKLNTFLSCPEKYRLMYEMGLRSPKSSPSLVEGSCIHHLVENAIAFPNIDDLLELANQAFWREHPFENCNYESEEHYLAAQTQCLEQTKAFLWELGPLRARHIELQVDSPLIHPLTMEEDPHISLTGFIDLVLVGGNGEHFVVDLKTVKRMPREGMARVALELSMYAYLYSMPFTPDTIGNVPVALVYLIRTKVPKVHFDESRRSLSHFLELYRICQKVAQDIERGHFWRNPGMHCGYCDCASLCYGEVDQAVELFGREAYSRYLADQEVREHVDIPQAVNF